MARTPKKSSAGVPAARKAYVVCNQEMEAVYHVPDLQPKASGQWRREAEKIAWQDPDTGYACIIRREITGYLCGYVAIGNDHPLFGFDARAIPREILQVHGGLDYSARCDDDGPEESSVCHVSDHRARHDDRWWLGFECDKNTDLVPDDPAHAAEARSLGIEQTYRTEQYVFEQCTDLAAQLHAVAIDTPSAAPMGLESRDS
ncbi:hypothetical protein [Sphingomonas sp. UYP23]